MNQQDPRVCEVCLRTIPEEHTYRDTLDNDDLCQECWIVDASVHEYLRACYLYYICDEPTGLSDPHFDQLERSIMRSIELVRLTKWGDLFHDEHAPGHRTSREEYPKEIRERVPYYLWEKELAKLQ